MCSLVKRYSLAEVDLDNLWIGGGKQGKVLRLALVNSNKTFDVGKPYAPFKSMTGLSSGHLHETAPGFTTSHKHKYGPGQQIG